MDLAAQLDLRLIRIRIGSCMKVGSTTVSTDYWTW